MKAKSLCIAVFVAGTSFWLGAGSAFAQGFKLEKGFVRLDNGNNLDGWQSSRDGEAVGWFVVDGAIYLNAKKARSHLVSTKTHSKNCIIRLQFKAAECADSGVYIHGSQLQVRDYPKAGPRKYAFAAKPAGQWNDLEWDINKGIAVVKLNGKVIEKAWRIGRNAKQGVLLQRERGDFWFRYIRIKERD